MFISRMSEDEGGIGERREVGIHDDHSHEYQTASELFELMAKKHSFQYGCDEDTLTTRDLVILYKNIDLGTKLMTSANEFKRRTPNQYVETIVYNEDPDTDSDISEIYSNEDLLNAVLVNKERIDLINNAPSVDNILCHKVNDLDIQTSNLTSEYDKHFLFKDFYFKEQLKSLNLMSNASLLPASLLDYICCKRLEDNYNFYMDNIIRYVKHIIEQLKRISNGDYLTDRAKEKWREVEEHKEEKCDNNAKILAKSTSIPLHVERKVTGHVTTWDDIVHSEVDVRYLSKILEKKIVLEIPKLICGSFKLFSKYCAENLVISCERENNAGALKSKDDSSVNVVFKLQRSESGHVISNINSIMILHKSSSSQGSIDEILPYKQLEITKSILNIPKLKKPKVVELVDQDQVNTSDDKVYKKLNIQADRELECKSNDALIVEPIQPEPPMRCSFVSGLKTYDHVLTDYPDADLPTINNTNDTKSREANDLTDNFVMKQNARIETPFDVYQLDDLRLTMQRLNIQTSLPEEPLEDLSGSTYKRKSPINRIKSPYENKSLAVEEKKRKKLLEIRQRRERKKIAMSETCKVTKNKYGKATIMPQTSNSVTKLSITNKSFYNSIYGQTLNMHIDRKQSKIKGRKDKRDTNIAITIPLDQSETENENVPTATPEVRSQKYVNRSYYLDDTVTEMMYLQMKQKTEQNKETISESTSAVSNDFTANIKMFSQLIAPSTTEFNYNNADSKTPQEKLQILSEVVRHTIPNACHENALTTSCSNDMIVPANTPKDDVPSPSCDKEYPKKANTANTSVEFRKSIDKIYDLMKKLGKSEINEPKLVKSKFTTIASGTTDRSSTNGGRGSSTIQCSDSGTSVKHHITSSNPSYFSFEKSNDVPKPKGLSIKKPDVPASVVPKIIISSKTQNVKTDGDKNKINKKKVTANVSTKIIPENPLKAISQLLHDFDNVQKIRQKTVDQKLSKKIETGDSKLAMRQGSYKRPHRQDNEIQLEKIINRKEKKPKPTHTEISKFHFEDKYFNKLANKQVADIVDEYKEARGEAVRGPSKLNSRLNSLAQPKKTYVQAHIEECQTKYGRNFMSDRLQKLAAAPTPQFQEKSRVGSANFKQKQRRTAADVVQSISTKLSQPASSLERVGKIKHSISASPEAMMQPPLPSLGVESSFKHTNTIEKQILKTKMVAVETYVKNHYGRVSTADSNTMLVERLTSQVPLIPNDIELASLTSCRTAEESTEIGKKLHHIIDSMINSTSPGLTVVAECNETGSKFSRDNVETSSLDDNLSAEDILTVEFNYDDYKLKEQTPKYEEKSIDCIQKLEGDQSQEYNSKTEIEQLEIALHRQLSASTFQKRLRLKNLTLTPKHSMQQVFVLQSGDVGSFVVKPVSQILYDSKSETTTGVKSISKSNTKLNNFTTIPMQISTVGYAFPVIKTIPKTLENVPGSDIRKKLSLQTIAKARNLSEKNHQCVMRCFQFEKSAQINVPNVVKSYPSIKLEFDVNTNLKQSSANKKAEIELSNTTNVIKSNSVMQNTSEIKTQREETSVLSDVSKYCQTYVDVKENKKGNAHAGDNSEHIRCTSSLDVLVGLLNEIQKITSCQTQIIRAENSLTNYETDVKLNDSLFDKSNKSRGLISITSHEKLRQLESSPSIYTFNLSNYKEKNHNKCKIDVFSKIIDVNKKANDKPLHADKEINVDYPKREFINQFTDVPSRIFPINVNHSTNVSNSLIGIISEPSVQSVFSFIEQSPLDSPFNNRKKIIELPQQIHVSQQIDEPIISFQDKVILVQIDDKNKMEGNLSMNKNKRILERSLKIREPTNFNSTKSGKVRDRTDYNSIMKMKRDILVTVYSILVFTVFAALSFPEIYRVD